ncbi:hypothetical protein AE78_01281 [Klebsiella pneumoniae CHS 22]|nr:hypothetical protein AE79_04291 [Klebsiella pneumoniae CHS 23]KDI42564.1 hypothetical protein AE78_01281 [Klebsiella pneumoniae CHS 22]
MSQQERATILLIDDHPMLRTGVKQLISMAAGHPGDWRGQQWRARY